MNHLRTCLFAVLVALCATSLARAQDEPRETANDAPSSPTILGAASNFSQGWRGVTFDAARVLPLRHYRDGMRWADVEKQPGVYRFNKAHLNYPARIGNDGAELVLTLNWGNPLYDNGKTPHSPAALAAFGRFAAAVVQRYPAITTLEIGNEFNGANFVSGPVLEGGLAQRGRYHLAMVRSAATAVRAVRPEVRVIGGSTHSIAAGYLWPILDNGGAQLLDGLAIHPYTTPIDQFAAQFGVLRRNANAATMPLWITEWGSQNAARAADDLVRGYTVLAGLGAQSLYWYPLNERGDGHIPLVARNGEITSAGEAYRFVQTYLATNPAQNVSPDSFTFAYAFGPNALVLWGEPRSLALSSNTIEAYDARGRTLDRRELQLSPDQPVIVIGDEALVLGHNVVLGCQTLVADTFYQFAFPPAQTEGFAPLIKLNGEVREWTTLPGQQRGGVPWMPYLGHHKRARLRLTAEGMVLAGRSGDEVAVIHNYTSPGDAALRLEARFAVDERSGDGVALSITAGTQSLLNEQRSGDGLIDKRLTLRAGETLGIVVANGPERTGDAAAYRLRLHDPRACEYETQKSGA